jgi:hypothetical protein
MKANFCLLSLIIFCITIACQSPFSNEEKILKELYSNLVDQRKFIYEVTYAEGFVNELPSFSLYGTGKLVRNAANSLSSFYFGPMPDEKEHYFFMLHNQSQYTEQIKSQIYDEGSADIVADSLHSAFLLNPEILLNLAEKEDQITICRQNGVFQYEFYNQQLNRHIIIETDKENHTLNKISIYQKSSNNLDYMRSWSFNHLSEEAYNEQFAVCAVQFESVNRRFL